ncbi:hydrolase [Massilia sp. WF1]|uniref:hydrolase 1, exosortase A system-associated n=1 Tax=unclassified Massilia TaxID=2609279 RepID=UPI000689C05E|nr:MULTISPECIES: hydrolase 1, exosortase A system-associated [unclassified Massilia]ALK95192.1 hydrolase [Massilia sp. WG5]KNZ67479.1 hydrolase [Massilia sp. WF1]
MHLEERALSFACGASWLYGVLSLPARPATRGVLIVVGGPQVRTGSHRQFTLLARSLAQAGIPAMRFDYRGMGDSEGAPRDFEQIEDDLRAAIDCFMAQAPGLEDVVLWGLCDGASAAAMYAPNDARVAGLALLNPWVRTEDGAARATLKHYYRSRLLAPELWKKIASGRFDARQAATSFAAQVRAAFGPKAPAAQQADSPAPLPERMHAALQRFGGRVLVMLSGADLTAQEFAGLSSGSRDWERLLAGPHVTRHTLPGADHTCSRREWHEQVVAWTAAWLRAA